MDVLNAMKIFKRVVELGSFTAVAHEQNISQPTVSKSITALETHLGIILINRSTRQLHVTELGREYYLRCSGILEDLAETETFLGSKKAQLGGILRLSVPVTFGRKTIAPLVWKFVKENKGLEVDISFDDSHVDLVREGVDLAIRSGPPVDSALISQKICNIARLAVASPAYLEQFGFPEKPEDLSHHECIIYSGQSPQHEWFFTTAEGNYKAAIGGRVKVNNPEASVDAALNDLGISISPKWLVRNNLENGSLIQVLSRYPPTPYEVQALYPHRKYVPAKVRNFIAYLKKELKIS